MFRLVLLVAVCLVGYLAVVAGLCRLTAKVIVPRVQARRFASAAVDWAQREHRRYRWEQWKRDHDL